MRLVLSNLEHLANTIAVCVEPFRFVQHARTRRLTQERESHERMMELLDTVLQRAENTSRANTDAVIALANSSQAHADALAKWFDLFQANMGEGSTHTVRPADESDAADKREMDRLREKGYPVDGTPEQQMAWLHGLPIEG